MNNDRNNHSILTLEKLSKAYGKKRALECVSYSFHTGLYGILGPNGAGKSTMMNLITDNLRPDSGRVLYNGKEISRLGKAYLTKLGYMPQHEGFYDAFSGRMFLLYMSEMKAIPKAEAISQIEEILERVNLKNDAHRKISDYSGGMKQRLLLAQALLGDPEILLLDEPTAGLDPAERIRLRNYIHTLAKERIILFTTHIVSDIQEIADQILMMKNGMIIKAGSIQKILGEIQDETGRNCSLEQAYLYVMGGSKEND